MLETFATVVRHWQLPRKTILVRVARRSLERAPERPLSTVRTTGFPRVERSADRPPRSSARCCRSDAPGFRWAHSPPVSRPSSGGTKKSSVITVSKAARPQQIPAGPAGPPRCRRLATVGAMPGARHRLPPKTSTARTGLLPDSGRSGSTAAQSIRPRAASDTATRRRAAARRRYVSRNCRRTVAGRPSDPAFLSRPNRRQRCGSGSAAPFCGGTDPARHA